MNNINLNPPPPPPPPDVYLLGNKADLCSILQLMTSLFLVNGHFLGVERGGGGCDTFGRFQTEEEDTCIGAASHRNSFRRGEASIEYKLCRTALSTEVKGQRTDPNRLLAHAA
jgi:hypothetical protein